MPSNDKLLLEIGAETSSFTAAMGKIEKDFRALSTKLQGKNSKTKLFEGSAEAFAKQMKKVERAAEISSKRIQKVMKGAHAGITDKEAARYEQMYRGVVANAEAAAKKEIAIRKKLRSQLKSLGVNTRNTKDVARLQKMYNQEVRQRNALYAKEQKLIQQTADYKARRSMLLYKRELAQIRRREAREKRATVSKVDMSSNGMGWGDKITQAARNVAVYGGMAKVYMGIENAVRATMGSISDFDTMIQQNIGVLDLKRNEAIELGKEVQRLGILYGESFMDIQDAMLALGRAGVNSTNIKAYTEQVVALASITGDSLNDSAIALVRYMQVYEKEAQKVDHFAGRMAYLVNETTLGMDDMKVIGNYALSAATSINLTYDSLIGLAGGFAKLGKQPSTIGTSIRRLGDITLSTTDKMTTAWRKLGVDQGKLQADFVKGGAVAKKAISDLIIQLGSLKFKDADRFQDALKGLNVRSKELLATLAQMGEVGKDNLFGDFSDTTNMVDAVEQAKKVSESFGKTWTGVVNTFKAGWTDAGLSFMEDMQPILKSLTVDGPNGANSFAESVRSMAEVMIASIGFVVKAVGQLVASLQIAWAGIKMIGSWGAKIAGEAMGGKSSEDITLLKTQIENLTKIGDKRTSSQNKLLPSLKEELKVYESMANLGDRLIDAGERGSIEAQQSIKNANAFADKVNEIGEAIKGVKTSGINTTLNKASEATKEIAKNQQGIVADVIAVKATKEQELALIKAGIQEQIRLKNMSPAVGQTKILENEKEFRKSIYDEAKKASEQDVANQEKYNRFIKTRMEYETAAQNVWQDSNRQRKKASDEAERAAKKSAAAGKRSAAAAKRAQRDKERASKNSIKSLVLEAKISHQITKNKMLAEGKGVSKSQQLQWAKELAVLKEKEAKATWEQARAQAVGADAIRKAREAYLDYQKAAGETFEAIDAEHQELADNIADGLEQAFDMILNGDLQSAFGGMFKSMISDAAKGGIKIIASAIAQGEAWSVAAIARGAAEGGYPGLIAMAAAMAALGLFGGSVGGSGGGTLSEKELTAAKGITGVESESVSRAAEIIARNTTDGLKYSSEMARSLRNLESQAGVASQNIGDQFSGDNYDSSYKNKDGIWGGKTYELLASGIILNPATLNEMKNGFMTGIEYMNEKKTQSSWFGLKTKESVQQTVTGEVDSKTIDAIAGAYESAVQTMQSAAEALGVSSAEFEAVSMQWETSLAQLNFVGKSAEERQEMIMGVIAADLDRWGGTLEAVSGYVDQFARAGEGTFETIVRMANDFEVLQRSFQMLGWQMPAVAQGGVDLSQALTMAGKSAADFASKLNTYFGNFYTTEEQLALKTKMLETQFAMLGYTMPKTSAGVRALVDAKQREIATIVGQIKAEEALANAKILQIQTDLALGNVTVAVAEQMMAAANLMLNGLRQALATAAASLDGLLDAANGWADVNGSIDSINTDQANAAQAAASSAQSAADSCASAAEDAKRAAEEARQLAKDITSMKASWMDPVEGGQMMLDLAKAQTGIVTSYETFLQDFVAASGNMNREQYDKWAAMSEALRAFQAALKEKFDQKAFRADWMSAAKGAEYIFKLTEKFTGLFGLTMDNFLNKFDKALAGGMTSDEFDKWQMMSDALKALEDQKIDALQKELDFYEDILQKIDDAHLGALSYLNSMEKAEYAAQAAQRAIDGGDSQGYIDNLGKQLEYEKKMSITKEEYIPMFDAYIAELKNAEPEKDINDAVNELEKLNEQLEEVQDAIEKASYQN